MLTKSFKQILAGLFVFISTQGLSQIQTTYPRTEAKVYPSWISEAQKKIEANRFNIVKSNDSLPTQDPDRQQEMQSPDHAVELDKLPQYAEGELFIKFKSSAASGLKSFSGKFQRESAIEDPVIRKALTSAKVSNFSGVANINLKKAPGVLFKAKIEEDASVEQSITILSRLPDVAYVERVPIYYTLQVPNDASYSLQYALDLVHAPKAFSLPKSGSDVYVAIVDDAFLYDHPDLLANVDVSKCYDVADNDADTRPPSSGTTKAGPFTFSHGTHVGGIVGAVTNNGFGVASISNNNIKMFGIKATRDVSSEPRELDVSFEGVAKAIENGADVINMSFGGTGPSTAWQEMINDATAQGVVFVAAAGNGNTSVRTYPAAYENVIAVANTDAEDEKNSTSHFGEWVDISAPGSTIYSTVVDQDGSSGAFSYKSGTSMSSPMVAGLAGLLMSENTILNPGQVLSIIQSTADDIVAANPGYIGLLGAGRINAYNALLSAKNLQRTPEADFISSSQNIFTGQSVVFSSQSLGNGLTYTWSFPGGSPSSASGKTVTVSYNSPGTYAVSLTVSNSAGSDVLSIPGYVQVITPKNCEILTFPFPGSRSYFYFPDNFGNSLGPVVGQNVNGFTQFANKYTYLPGDYVNGALFAVGKLVSENPETAKVTFKVWGETTTTGRPGKVLATQDVSFEDIVVANISDAKSDRTTYTEVIFDNPPQVPEDGVFYLGFEIYYASGDTIGFYTNDDGDGDGGDSFFFNNDAWSALSEIDELQANIEMAPIMIAGNYLNENDFIVEAGACAGDALSFSTENLLNAVAFEWTFDGGMPLVSSEANPIIYYNNPGEYTAELIITVDGCDFVKKRLTQTVKIVDCEQSPVAEFTADKRTIAAGDSVQFFEQSEHATGYTWVFEGGNPVNASVPDPVITYPNPGTFNVNLEVQNPEADVSSLVKDNFITVLNANACDIDFGRKLNDRLSGSGEVYTSSDGGYIVGNNASGDLGKAELFTYQGSGAKLDHLLIRFGVVNGATSGGKVTIVLYDSDGPNGSPGSVLATKDILLSEIQQDINNSRNTAVFFDETIIPSRSFYAGVLLDYESEAEIAIVASGDLQTTGTAWELTVNSDGISSWNPISQRWFFGSAEDPDYLDISLFVSAVFEDVIKVPFVNLTVSPSTIQAGGTIRFNANESFGYEEFEWQSSADVTFDQDALTQEVLFPKWGTYTVSFIARNGCSRETVKEVTVEISRNPLSIDSSISKEVNLAVYPNPFVASTTFDFHLKKPSHVEIEIYNSTGQKVYTFGEEFYQAGNYQKIFEANGLPKGLYIYRFQLDHNQEVRGRIILQ